MKQFFLTIVIAIIATSCNNIDGEKASKASKKQVNEISATNAADIAKDFKTWYNYTYHNIHLAQAFVGLDTNSGTINKTEFLELLATGKYIPVEIKIENKVPTYQLYKLTNKDPDIKMTISQMALTETMHYKMEGKELPDYDFTDLTGKTYNNSTTKGKILVVKCWFIHCVACVKEFPELNKLVDQYETRDDIQFVSLAMDSKQELLSFLKTKEFKYAVVPDKEKYMAEQLRVIAYPTHILVDKEGKIVKVVNAIDDLIPFLEKQAG